MPHVQPEASVVATGKGVRYVGAYLYGYSGAVPATNSADNLVTVLKYTSSSKIEKVFFQYFDGSDATWRRVIQLKLNELIVFTNSYDGSPENGGHGIYYNAIIPPLTKVEFLSNIVQTGTAIEMFITMTGRAYGIE